MCAQTRGGEVHLGDPGCLAWRLGSATIRARQKSRAGQSREGLEWHAVELGLDSASKGLVFMEATV